MSKKKLKTLNATNIPEQFGGIYFLISERTNIIKYIGMSLWDVYSRVLSHDLTGYKVKILRVNDRNKIRWYERRWIQKYKPRYNKFIPMKRTNYLHNPYNQ